MSCDYAHYDGVYVLGALPAAERAAYERHLADCVDCSRAVRELAGLPGLLGRVGVDLLEAPVETEPVPTTLLPALLAQTRRRERRRLVRSVSLAAAAAALVAGGLVATVAVAVDHDDPTSAAAPEPAVSTAPSQRMHSSVPDTISGWVSLTEVGWGTRIDLTCTYGTAGDGYATWAYVMVVHTTDGATEQVGTWRATPDKESHVAMATSVPPDRIASVVVETADGTPVLRLTE